MLNLVIAEFFALEHPSNCKISKVSTGLMWDEFRFVGNYPATKCWLRGEVGEQFPRDLN